MGSAPGCIHIFEEWVRRDVGKIYVQMFDVTLSSFVGQPSLQEMMDIDQFCELQQIFAGIQKGELAAVAGGEFPDR